MSFSSHSSPVFSESINKGFSKQSETYDQADHQNQILQDLRHQVYAHVHTFLTPGSHILELNAGTGLDALYFCSKGNFVHATDISDGMIAKIKLKISETNHTNRLTCQQVSFTELNKVDLKKFDYVFSNFGGLNCIPDLSLVTRHLAPLLKTNAYLTWVIMPPICLWELLWVLKGAWKKSIPSSA